MTEPGIRRRRRRALAIGFVIVGSYAALAAWSSGLSPLARGPLLDGLAPVNYRWVNPPADLASTNEPPSSGRFSLALGADGVEGMVVFTSDDQVTVIVASGSIPRERGQHGVNLTVTPIDPATMPPAPEDLTVLGNAYRIEATYRPSGDAVRDADLTEALDVILVYPTTVHATPHRLLYSGDGATWSALESTSSQGSQQAEGSLPGFGTVAVGGRASSVPATGSTGDTTFAVILLVAAACVLLVGIALLIRSRRTDEPGSP